MSVHQCPCCYTPFTDNDLEDGHLRCSSCSFYINQAFVNVYYRPAKELKPVEVDNIIRGE